MELYNFASINNNMPESIDELHLLVLNVGLAIHHADWNWKNVSSPFARIYYVTEGSAYVVLPESTWELKPHHLYLIPAFTKHDCICNSYFSHYYVHIYEDHQSKSDIWEEWSFPIEIPAQDFDLELFKRLCEINPTMKLLQSDPTTYDNNPTLIQNILKNKQRPYCDKVESRGIIFQLFSHFLKDAKLKSEAEDDRIEKTLAYIRKNIFESIDLDTLARISCLSKDHFIRLFKKEMKTTPLQYINRKKIEKAQLILLTNNMPIKNIAYLLGYEDQSYFNRFFKKIIGMTPQKYRYSIKK